MLEVVTPASSARLTTAAAVRAMAGVTTADDLLNPLIDQASARIVAECGRPFARETYRETVHLFEAQQTLVLQRWPVASVSSVTINSTALVPGAYGCDNTAATVTRVDGTRRPLWPRGQIIATYTAGYILPGADGRDLPHDIERAALLLVIASLNSAGRDPALRAVEVDGISRREFFSEGYTEPMPAEVASTITLWRQLGAL